MWSLRTLKTPQPFLESECCVSDKRVISSCLLWMSHTYSLKRKMEGKKYLLSANYCGSLLLTVNVNPGWVCRSGLNLCDWRASNPDKDNQVVPYQDHLSRVLDGVQSLQTDCSLDDFRQCAKRVISELLVIEKKLKEQEIGVNVAKTLTTFQGGLGAALCLISAPVGVAVTVSFLSFVTLMHRLPQGFLWHPYCKVAGVAAAATAVTFGADKYLNRKRHRESEQILQRDEFLTKMKIVMEKLGISDEKLASFQTVSDEKSCFEEDIQDLVNRIFKFVTDNRLHDIFRAFGFSRAASSSRQAFEVFAQYGLNFSSSLSIFFKHDAQTMKKERSHTVSSPSHWLV